MRFSILPVLSAFSLGFFGGSLSSQAAGFTWTGSSSNLWSNATNWTPATVPVSGTNFAVFDASSGPNITIDTGVNLEKFQINAGAPSLTFQNNSALQFRELGIQNLSASSVTIVNSNDLRFRYSASAGSANISTTMGGTTRFFETSSAGSGLYQISGTSISAISRVVFNETSSAANATFELGSNSDLRFYDNSTASGSTIKVTGSTAFDALVVFFGNSNAGTATITVTNAASRLQFEDSSSAADANISGPGGVHFRDRSTAGSATILYNTGNSGAFFDSSSAGNAQLTVEGSLVFNLRSTAAQSTIGVSTGGSLLFQESTTAGEAVITLASGASLEFRGSYATAGDSTIDVAAGGVIKFVDGSAGSATISSDADVLFQGTSSDTSFDGSFSGAGGLIKTGGSTIRLLSANTFTGGTLISGGVLQTADASALANGDVTLQAAGQLSLADGSNLHLAALGWEDGGTVSLSLGSGSKITSTLLTQSGTGSFLFTDGGVTMNTRYELLTFDNAGSTFNVWSANYIGGLEGSFIVEDNGNGTSTVYVSYIGTAGGDIIDNGGTAFTPATANFEVVGNVVAAPGAQQVNSLTFTDGSTVAITQSLAVNSGTFVVLSGSSSVTGGLLTTPGDLNKSGAGLLDLQGQTMTGGQTVVSQGALAVNGALFTSCLQVQQNTLLKGSGLIVGNVVNNGTVAPGNSPGILTVNGNFTQTSLGTLEIEVSDSAFDQLLVTGVASLAGTLQAIPFDGHVFEFGDQIPFLQAGSIAGTFEQIVVPQDLRGRFVVEGNTGILLVAPESYTQVAQNKNQENVAAALDSFIGASGDRDVVSLALDLQTANEYGNAFDQISPGFYQSLTDIVIEQSVVQSQMLAQRLSSVRLGARGFNVIGLDQAALTVDRDGKNVMDARSDKDIISRSQETDWSVFVQGNGIFARVTNVSQVPNYNFDSGGFIVGADYTFGGPETTTSGDGKKAVVTTTAGSTLTLGLYTGYQGTYASYVNGSNTTINSALFGGYASYSNGGFYSDLVVGGSYNAYRVARSIDFSTIDRTARSTPDGGTFTTYLDAGYDFHAGAFTFGPLISGQYTYAGTAGFTENGADSLDLSVNQQNANSLRTNIGGRVAFTWQATSTITVIPEARLFWQHEYLNGNRNIGASLDGGNGPGFGFETGNPDRDSVFAGAGVSVNFGDRLSTYLYYNANFARPDFLGNMISGGLSWKF